MGLKTENNVTYITDDSTQEWIAAPTTIIHELERLLHKLEVFNYPKVSIKENIIFEVRHDLGTTSVRAFKDEDGDFTLSCQHKDEPIITLNEDAAFGFDVEKEHAVNYWQSAKKSYDNESLYNHKRVDNIKGAKAPIIEKRPIVNEEKNIKKKLKTGDTIVKNLHKLQI